MIPDEERRTAEEALLTAVELLLWMPESRVYAFSEYRRMLEAAGFEAVTRDGEEVISAGSS